jgi:hypothetical protein
MTLLRQPCNRLTENCNKSGCVDQVEFVGDDADNKEEFKQRVCDCSANYAFYFGGVVAVIGMAIGLYYLPPPALDVKVDPSVSQWSMSQTVGGIGHIMWVGFVLYCAYRATYIDAGDQLDKACRQISS